MLPRRYVWLIVVPAALIVIGTMGFALIEGWSLLDSLYVTVITLSTVGYGDLTPRSAAGRLFTIFLVLGGVFTLFYAAAEVIRVIVSGEVRAIFGRQRMERSLAELKDHLIICGYGRMGRFVCKEFETRRLPYVVIDHDPDALADFDLEHGIALAGDVTSDEDLRHAGVERARALVTVVASDADNLFVTMSARLLNDKLFIVARAEDEEAEKKMKRAGANRVVCPYSIGGTRVAQAVLRPTVVDFIELATRTEHLELQIEEMQVSPRGRLAGITLQESGLRRERGIIVMAIKKPDGKMVYNPFGETRLEAGDILIALGNRKQLDEFDKLASG